MSFSAVVFLFGAVSLSLGLLGEGVSVKDISIPKINRVSRFTLIIVGAFFMLIGLGVHDSTAPTTAAISDDNESVETSSAQENLVATDPQSSETPASTPSEHEFQNQVRQQLIYIADRFSNEGFSLIDSFVSGLSEGSTHSEWVTLEAGKTYFLNGVCDSDCTDIDLWLHDENGTLIDSDVEVDDYPYVTVVPQQTGNFVVTSSLPDCNANYCYYGIGLFQASSTVTGTGVTY